MAEFKHKNFNHLKIHSQYSICEGAIKIDELKNNAKESKISSLALCDTSNMCGAIEFSDKLSKVGTQPIIGTQINFKFQDTTGLLPLFALNQDGYKKIIELSSKSGLILFPYTVPKSVKILKSIGLSVLDIIGFFKSNSVTKILLPPIYEEADFLGPTPYVSKPLSQ